MNKIKVAYLLSNPIQYQSPMLKELNKQQNIDLKVLFRSKRSLKPHKMPGFNVVSEWDLDLLDGFEYSFLPTIGSDEHFSFFKPLNYGLFTTLKDGKFDVLWLHGYSDLYSLYAIFIAKLLGIKVIVRGESYLLGSYGGKFRKLIRKTFFKILNKFVDGFMNVGTANKKFYEYYKIPSKKIFFSPYTVDNLFFQNRIAKQSTNIQKLKYDLGLEENKPIILYASSMLKRKFPEDLLQAYINLSKDGITPPNAYLIFIGDGEQRPILESKAKEVGWNTIKILGFKSQNELAQFYGISDIFVLPSTYETWGLVINEAMNAKLAIVSSNEVGSSFDLVKNGTNGYTYQRNNIDELSKSLDEIITDKQLCEKMGEESFRIINGWGIPETVAGIVQACNTVTKN